MTRPTTFACSFCGKRPRQVKQLIGGPGGIAICDECVGLCAEIVADEEADRVETIRQRDRMSAYLAEQDRLDPG